MFEEMLCEVKVDRDRKWQVMMYLKYIWIIYKINLEGISKSL
jgi:hypothetical protein